MKTSLLILMLSIITLPGFSQSPKGKKHTPALHTLRQYTERPSTATEKARFTFLEAGSIIMKNNAIADSMLVYMDMEKGDFELLAKELPVYYEGSFLIKELETWYNYGDGEFIPGEKTIATYDHKGNIIRLEGQNHDGEQWEPAWAEEMLFDNLGQEILYIWYFYNTDSNEWEVYEGYRAIDQYTNDLLQVRIWETYQDYKGWEALEMEEYIYDENDLWTGIIFSDYDSWNESWITMSMVMYDLDENNTWTSGYSYIWDEDQEEWVDHLKFVDMQWFDFDLLQIESVIVMININSIPEWKNLREDEVIWLDLWKISGQYTDNGLLTQIRNEEWNDEIEQWETFMLIEKSYDNFDNTILDLITFYYEGEMFAFGYKLDVDYNSDLSIQSFVYSYMTDEMEKFTPILQYDYYYTDQTVSAPVTEKPGQLNVYPNPASSAVNITWAGGDDTVEISVISLEGRILSTNSYNVYGGNVISLDVSDLKNGMYFIRSQGKAGQQVARFIKK